MATGTKQKQKQKQHITNIIKIVNGIKEKKRRRRAARRAAKRGGVSSGEASVRGMGIINHYTSIYTNPYQGAAAAEQVTAPVAAPVAAATAVAAPSSSAPLTTEKPMKISTSETPVFTAPRKTPVRFSVAEDEQKHTGFVAERTPRVPLAAGGGITSGEEDIQPFWKVPEPPATTETAAGMGVGRPRGEGGRLLKKDGTERKKRAPKAKAPAVTAEPIAETDVEAVPVIENLYKKFENPSPFNNPLKRGEETRIPKPTSRTKIRLVKKSDKTDEA